MDGTGDQFLTGARLAMDQDRGVRGGNATDLVEHRRQSRAPADDLLEVVDRLDLLLKVRILLTETCALGLGQNSVGDVDPRRASAASRG
jgi:hypothetical protein